MRSVYSLLKHLLSGYCILAAWLDLRKIKGELFQDSASQELKTKKITPGDNVIALKDFIIHRCSLPCCLLLLPVETVLSLPHWLWTWSVGYGRHKIYHCQAKTFKCIPNFSHFSSAIWHDDGDSQVNIAPTAWDPEWGNSWNRALPHRAAS